MTIHRFKFSIELNNEIQTFSNRHMYDNDEDFIDNFEKWVQLPNITELINSESETLNRHNYGTDIKIKIYRSIKYYYVKKFSLHDKKEKKQRDIKHAIDPIILQAIKDNLMEHFNTNPTFKPSDTFIEFIKNYSDNINLKKCYKNQYYQIKNKLYT